MLSFIYLFTVIYTFLIIYLKNLWRENEHLVKVAENLIEYAKQFFKLYKLQSFALKLSRNLYKI